MTNAFIENFDGRLRDELLNETLFASLDHAREAPADWKEDYNTVRPHGANTAQMRAGLYLQLDERWGSVQPA